MFKKMWSKKAVIPVLASLIAIGCQSSSSVGDDVRAAQTGKTKENHAKIKNVIVMIGDGMGPAYTTAYRYFKDDPSTPMMEETVFDKYFVGMQKTYPHDEHENITDSAAAATAMSAAVKTYNGAIAVNTDREPVETVLEQAKKRGKSTGLVATSQINHATPAAFAAHNEDRHNYNEIADAYYDDRINGEHKVDVMLGGGTNYFIREDRNLVKQFKQNGYSYVTTREELLKDDNDQILGLFAPVGLPKAIDRTKEIPSLEEMTTAAIERLDDNKKGFFLMVEGSQIDWAGHDNDIVGAMSEMEDFADAVQAAIAYAKKDKHTLVVVTADHSTGGLSVGSGYKYVFYPKAIQAAKITPDFMAEKIASGADVETVLDQYIDFDLSAEEIQSVKKAAATKDDDNEVHNAIEKIFSERSHTGWTTTGHTGVDVQVFAYGPGTERFAGMNENTNLAEQIFNIFKR
ncbi:MAG TPA: alkaline phosphatase [Bacillales bacterium]|nr:alkaline phosphatase [Bacillales bacterium]